MFFLTRDTRGGEVLSDNTRTDNDEKSHDDGHAETRQKRLSVAAVPKVMGVADVATGAGDVQDGRIHVGDALVDNLQLLAGHLPGVPKRAVARICDASSFGQIGLHLLEGLLRHAVDTVAETRAEPKKRAGDGRPCLLKLKENYEHGNGNE